MAALSFKRPVVVAVVALCALGCLGTARPQAVGASSPIPPDAALTQRLLAIGANASPPPANDNDFLAIMNTPVSERGSVYGRIVWRAPRGDAPARGLKVFLIALDDYTAWFAAQSSASALADKDSVASLDYGVRYRALFATTADRDGNFVFEKRAPGTYVLFAVLHETIGLASPNEQVQRGWDGRGHGADVVVPSITIPESHTVSFRYLYGFALPAGRRSWYLGTLRATNVLRDGQPVTAATP